MFRAGILLTAGALAGASVWAGFALTAQEPKPAADAKPADLTALREAVAAAAKRGENVDEIRKALDAFEKALPGIKPGAVPPELQALRDAVESAAKKGENVDAVAKELAAVETAVAGRSLARPKPVPPPEVPMEREPPRRFDDPNPFGVVGGGLDAEAFQKGMDLRMKALELMSKNPRDPEAVKLLNEANQLMLKAMRPALGGRAEVPLFPDLGRVPDFNNRAPERGRLGIRFEKLNAVTADQLGLDPDVGVAVAAVVPGSAAEQAGLKIHDIIVAFAGKPASGNTDEFIRQVNAAKAGEKLDIVVVRKGKKVEIKGVVLADLGRAPAAVPDLPAPRLPAINPVPFPVPAPGVAPIPEKTERDTDNIRAALPDDAKPDLSDLSDAVAAAAKRGENVDSIKSALVALEKALAKGAVKKDEAPPELTALREAVEGAAKKGENVAQISKELGLIEKALTGREYVRPKVEEPVPEFPRRGAGAFGGGGFGPPGGGFGGRGRVVVGGDGFNTTAVTVSNGNFVIRARLNDVTFTITGATDAPNDAKITIKDGDKTIEAESLKKVPEEHRPAVEKLLKMVNR